MAGDDPAGAETLLVRSPCPGGRGQGSGATCSDFRGIGNRLEFIVGVEDLGVATLMRSLGVTEVGRCLTWGA